MNLLDSGLVEKSQQSEALGKATSWLSTKSGSTRALKGGESSFGVIVSRGERQCGEVVKCI